MQSCLEFTSMDARHIQEARSDYQRNNQYSATHPDALASSGNGKGTGHGGHTHWLPNCRGTIGIINYSNFDTQHGGNQYDIEGRNGIGGRLNAIVNSLYNAENPYGLSLVDTIENINEGQYYMK